jgi:hypothetical protein
MDDESSDGLQGSGYLFEQLAPMTSALDHADGAVEARRKIDRRIVEKIELSHVAANQHQGRGIVGWLLCMLDGRAGEHGLAQVDADSPPAPFEQGE